ncbi:MAG: MaoC family dehydratase N-terminal domain-containing protein [Planctomycetia bacterium]|nr:MaoC family dehydratase N-terminal domain-containing protein [Planctomycetia bacterium]
MNEPLYFEELVPGTVWRSHTRTITESDIVNFACLTGDFDPLHVDHEFARKSPYGRPIAHGLFGLALVAGMGIHAPWASTVSFVQVREWKFLEPIGVGDTVRVITEILDKTPRGRRQGIVVWRRQLVNQSGSVVQEGVFETLVALSHTKTHDGYRTEMPEPAGPQIIHMNVKAA